MTNLYTGQVPLRPLRVNILSDSAGQDLSVYTSVELHILSPEGVPVDTTGGSIVLDEATQGVIKFRWPSNTLFPTAGDYTVQIRLASDTSVDYTTTDVISVYNSLENA